MNNMKKIRKSLGLSQSSLADTIGVTQGMIGHYESGYRKPSLTISRIIVSFFNEHGANCTLDDVFPPDSK